MTALATVQAWVALILGVLLLGMSAFAVVDALRHRADAFVAAGKLTKPIWLGINGVCAAIALLMLTQSPLSIFGIIAAVGSGVYLADVRPKLREVEGNRGRGNTRW
ncbi:DUF2516 family protein [Calidifontibacter sp. DB0510]|uniref:DUF2516 family protein n=1 Tax=Metallococcus carri TaxID=1656884 RepID=A0A967B4K6_9MICO|nr:DUF2516 family protein [Metallococcus carri]NHN55512.1 DUF2516 family protein [Metallococcus carri]NOP38304.1 DUF2516 family protein [Calidifontibacter sp. DB2511S]